MPVPKYSVWLGQKETFSKDWLSKPGMAQFGLLLSSVTKEVKAFEEATSPMAKRNVALAIQERIADFEKAWKKAYGLAPLPKQLAELQAAAREQVGMNISVHKYDYVSCIAYKVGTAKFDEALFRASWNATLKKYEFPRLVQYAGEQAAKAKAPESFSAQRARMMQADELDYGQRRARMQEAIGKAFELYQSKHGSESSDAKTLKIFMAPEFFFRGFYGAYDVSAVTEIFTALRGFTKDAKFDDWLFVFGTVIAAYFDDQLVCWNCNKMGAAQFKRRNDLTWYCPDCADGGDVAEGRLGARIVNVALIQKGGEDTDRNSYVVDKEYVSHVDFRRHVTAKALSEGKKISGYNNVAKLEPWKSDRQIELLGVTVKALPPDGSRDVGGGAPSKFADERMGGSIFTIDGIKIGLEICLDHTNGRIGPGTGIQIQLVPSAGASLKQFACIPHGIAFNVDGQRDGTCNVRINDSGKTPESSGTLSEDSGGVPSGGQIVVYKPHPIPYA